MSKDIMELQTEFSKIMHMDKEYDRVASIFEKSYGTDEVCISTIFKINNKNLEQNFMEQYDAIKAKRGKDPQIVEVFHGTTMDATRSIIITGFDPSYSKIAAYGKGTYCSPKVKTAIQYCKDAHTKGATSMIFLCRFIKGNFVRGTTDAIIDTKIGDYSGNNNDIYVTPYKYGIIPDYLICYYAWDK